MDHDCAADGAGIAFDHRRLGWCSASLGGHNEFGIPDAGDDGSGLSPNTPAMLPRPKSRVKSTQRTEETEWMLAGTSVLVALIGFYFAWLLYYKRPELPDKITAKIHGVYLMVLHKYYVDEVYGATHRQASSGALHRGVVERR